MNGRRRLRRGALAAIVIAAAAAGVAIVHGGASPATPPNASVVLDLPLARAVYATYTVRVHAQGRVGSPSGGDRKLAFADPGIVERVDVHVGETVAAGEALAELDRSGIAIDASRARSDARAAAAAYGGGSVPRTALAAAQARLEAAQDRLATLERGVGSAQSDRIAALAALHGSEAKLAADQLAAQRAATLFAGGVTVRKDVEAAQAQVDVDRADAQANRARAASSAASIGEALAQARADVAQAESDRRSARAQLTTSAAAADAALAQVAAVGRTFTLATLRAPGPGVIKALLKAPGEAVDPTQPAVVLATRSSGEITLTVSGADARSVQPGDAVTIATLGPVRRSGSGQVRSVVAALDPATQATTIVAGGVPPLAVSGEAVDATIAVAKRAGVLIPTSAIVEDPGSGKLLVFVRNENTSAGAKFAAREITAGSGDDVRTIVRSGLRAGERVAVQGAFDLLAPSGGN